MKLKINAGKVRTVIAILRDLLHLAFQYCPSTRRSNPWEEEEDYYDYR